MTFEHTLQIGSIDMYEFFDDIDISMACERRLSLVDHARVYINEYLLLFMYYVCIEHHTCSPHQYKKKMNRTN
jgi:hypothetical protein